MALDPADTPPTITCNELVVVVTLVMIRREEEQTGAAAAAEDQNLLALLDLGRLDQRLVVRLPYERDAGSLCVRQAAWLQAGQTRRVSTDACFHAPAHLQSEKRVSVHLECDVLLLQDNIVGGTTAGDGAHGPHLVALLDTLAVGALVATRT